ncbi:MAG TPA: hypothetical protein V6C65_10225, partial [Allocoleopsis sp.]
VKSLDWQQANRIELDDVDSSVPLCFETQPNDKSVRHNRNLEKFMYAKLRQEFLCSGNILPLRWYARQVLAGCSGLNKTPSYLERWAEGLIRVHHPAQFPRVFRSLG